MSKWVKKATVTIQRPVKWICDFGEEHFSIEGQHDCGNGPDVPENAKPGGFVTIRHGRKKQPRTADSKSSVAFAMTRQEAKRLGYNPPVKSRRKAPSINAPMWKMDNEQRRRAASRAWSL